MTTFINNENWVFILSYIFSKTHHLDLFKSEQLLSIFPLCLLHHIANHTLFFFSIPSSLLGHESFYNSIWNHIESNVYLFLFPWHLKMVPKLLHNLNGILLLEMVTTIHLFREVINKTIQFIQYSVSVFFSRGKVLKTRPSAFLFLELAYKVIVYSHLSKNKLLIECHPIWNSDLGHHLRRPLKL